MSLTEMDGIVIKRLQILVSKVKTFERDIDKWYYLGYISSLADEMVIRSTPEQTTVTQDSKP